MSSFRTRCDSRPLIGNADYDKYRYTKAVKALKRLRENYERAGNAAGFGAHLDGLRDRQRRKYSFIAKPEAAFAMQDRGPS
jgi:hypothetical protein